ncbi:hypothetical protein RvY_11966-2 [Ramazzottius varieornatus]|uniref:BTB domain-containing protein n=1 Tax=Ramazzottius varieornatus TaxID=947166 RepID=A0A1D1VM67_RAMVA|nr:hypothetical protein RvY_11966-2 [Ramazzottius varieornatus]
MHSRVQCSFFYSRLPRQQRIMGSVSTEEVDNVFVQAPSTDQEGDGAEEGLQIPEPAVRPGTPTPNWQCERSSLLDRSQFLLENNEALSDVVFIVGKGIMQREIPAHRFLLAMGSPVFETMFFGPTRQVADGQDVHLPDIEPAAFRNLLRFVYTDDVSGIDDETVMPTLYAAKKYTMPQLQGACVDFLRKNTRPENVFVVLEQAQQSEEPELVDQCLDLIDRCTHSVISTKEFHHISFQLLRMVLQRDGLSARELELFNSLVRWADSESERRELEINSLNRRKMMGAALFDIRFPLMSVEEFANGPGQSDVLTAEETRDLFLHMFAANKPEIPFSATPRRGPCGQEYTVTRFTEVGGSWGYGGGADCIRFSVDHDIALLGCGIYGGNDGSTTYAIVIDIKTDTQSGSSLLHQTTELQTDGSKTIFRVLFKEPVMVRAGNTYSISVLFEGPPTFRGMHGSSKISTVVAGQTESACTFLYSDSPDSQNGTSLSEGQIPSLIFCLV